MITKETRNDSYIEILKKAGKRQKQIIQLLHKYGTATARELAEMLYFMGVVKFYNTNTTNPRLNELVKLGIVCAEETKYDDVTNRTVAVYKLNDKLYQ